MWDVDLYGIFVLLSGNTNQCQEFGRLGKYIIVFENVNSTFFSTFMCAELL